MKILVCDDEKLLVKGIKFNLETEGYQVEVAYNGADCINLAKNGITVLTVVCCSIISDTRTTYGSG